MNILSKVFSRKALSKTWDVLVEVLAVALIMASFPLIIIFAPLIFG